MGALPDQASGGIKGRITSGGEHDTGKPTHRVAWHSQHPFRYRARPRLKPYSPMTYDHRKVRDEGGGRERRQAFRNLILHECRAGELGCTGNRMDDTRRRD